MDVVDYLKDVCQVEIQIDNRGLKDAGLSTPMPNARSTASRARDAVLQQVLGGLGMKHAIQDEVILITAACAGKSRPPKPPAGENESQPAEPPSDEQAIVDRLELLGAQVWRRDVDLSLARNGDEVVSLVRQLPNLHELYSGTLCSPRVTDHAVRSATCADLDRLGAA